MTKNIRIIITALLAIIAASAFYLVIPASTSFIASHIFVCLSIIFTAVSLIGFGRKNAKSIAGVSYVVLAVGYAITTVIFSTIGCLWLSGKWTIVGHIVLMVIYLIITIFSTIGSDYTNKIDEKDAEKRAEFEKEKANYWK
jgi:hypothetical protein